jgi:uncharacterized protein YecT (DUF1311 family)
VKALHEVLTFERFGLVPLTQFDMKIATHKELEEANDKMNSLFREIEARVSTFDLKIAETHPDPKAESWFAETWLSCLKDTQNKWLEFRKSHCEFDTYLNRGGTIHSLFFRKGINEADSATHCRAGGVVEGRLGAPRKLLKVNLVYMASSFGPNLTDRKSAPPTG